MIVKVMEMKTMMPVMLMTNKRVEMRLMWMIKLKMIKMKMMSTIMKMMAI